MSHRTKSIELKKRRKTFLRCRVRYTRPPKSYRSLWSCAHTLENEEARKPASMRDSTIATTPMSSSYLRGQEKGWIDFGMDGPRPGGRRFLSKKPSHVDQFSTVILDFKMAIFPVRYHFINKRLFSTSRFPATRYPTLLVIDRAGLDAAHGL